MNLNATIFGQAISFILFVWFCMKYIWPPIMNAIEMRQKEINEALLCAKKSQEEVHFIQNKITEKMRETKEKIKIMLNEADKQKTYIIEKAKKNALEESKKMFLKTQSDIDIQISDARNNLHEETVDLAIAIAEKIIKEHIQQNIKKDLTDHIISSLSKAKIKC